MDMDHVEDGVFMYSNYTLYRLAQLDCMYSELQGRYSELQGRYSELQERYAELQERGESAMVSYVWYVAHHTWCMVILVVLIILYSPWNNMGSSRESMLVVMSQW